jgi:hypothetical protein
MRLITPDDSRSVASRHLLVLTYGVICLWGIMAVPAWWLRGFIGLEGMTYSGLLCLVPGWLVVFVTARYPESGSPAMAILLGLGTRMAFALIGVLTFINLRPELLWNEQHQVDLLRFVVWLLCYYFAFLFMETLLLIGDQRKKKKTT